MILFDMLALLLLAAAAMTALRWAATTPPAQLLRGMRWLGVAMLVGLGLFLALTGRVAFAVAALAGLGTWAMRGVRAHATYKYAREAWRRAAANRPRPGAASTVRTAYLHMRLHHDSGDLSGEVVAGRFTGRSLDSLTLAEVLALHDECRADAPSTQVLEAWADRAHPDWRTAQSAAPPPAAAQAMSREEALEILDLPPHATPEAIKQAHHRLMMMVHPDRGGSTYLAAKINQAKDLLLGS